MQTLIGTYFSKATGTDGAGMGKYLKNEISEHNLQKLTYEHLLSCQNCKRGEGEGVGLRYTPLPHDTNETIISRTNL